MYPFYIIFIENTRRNKGSAWMFNVSKNLCLLKVLILVQNDDHTSPGMTGNELCSVWKLMMFRLTGMCLIGTSRLRVLIRVRLQLLVTTKSVLHHEQGGRGRSFTKLPYLASSCRQTLKSSFLPKTGDGKKRRTCWELLSSKFSSSANKVVFWWILMQQNNHLHCRPSVRWCLSVQKSGNNCVEPLMTLI